MTKETWSDTQKLLAFVLVVAFIVIILLWMLHPPSADAGTTSVLNTLVGTLGGMAGMVVTFYFGSSQGSKDKDTAMRDIATHVTGTGNGNGTVSTTTTSTSTTTPAEPTP
jgi:hypothetical protein